MRKRIIAIMLASVLLLSGCKKDGETNSGENSPTSDVTVTPELYSAYDAFDTVAAKAGYYDSENGKQLVEQYFAKYNYTLSDFKLDLQKNPEVNLKIADLFNSVSIKMSEIDWSTVTSVYDHPVFTDTGSSTNTSGAGDLHLTNDTEEFIRIMKKYGYKPYKKLLAGIGPIGDLIGSVPDQNLIEDMLTEYSPTDILTMYTSKAKMLSQDTIEFKPLANKSYFYEFARRNGFKYVTFFPTVCESGNAPVYMREPYGTSEDIPTWQAYFILYADYLYNKQNLDVASAIYNVTNDGIECWWSPSTGRTIELDIYASGLIRLVYGNDDRYLEYQEGVEKPSEGTEDKTIRKFIFDKLVDDYSYTENDFNSFVEMCKVFYLPCANIDLNKPSSNLSTYQMQGWLDAASIYSNYLSKGKMQKLTPYEYSKYLVDFVNVGRNDPTITDALSLCATDKDNTNTLANAATINPALIDIYKSFTDRLLNIVESKSTFLLEGYNSIITNIEYIGDNSADVAALYAELNSTSPLIYNLGRVTLAEVLHYDDLLALYNNDAPNVDVEHVRKVLSMMQSAQLTEDTKLVNAVQITLNWIAYERSTVTKTNIMGLDKTGISEWRDIPLKELSKNTNARKAVGALLQEAINFADIGADGEDKGIVIAEVLIAK